ncbi:ATP-binding cassette domain-containing protein [Corynebacterium hansenii]|uniref:ATP-binding cassette domain-containing protein n=1 Tax=Corynebacterium hansenii TaxID=394964 RepID=A0ABV7ZNT4_9CORY|nr:ATP-binding cassette domain-containing protein [Corynebacterium hansenii]WJZ00507.1 putative ABC transporter ATP-binding protein [Corynebacterium hansenii]
MTIGIADVVVRRRGHTILDRANLELGPGIHGIIGRNGVGKTTLLRVLARHMRVTAGTVRSSDTTALGRVAPDVRFAGATVGQHLDVAAVGHPGLDRELALGILAAAGIDARARTATLSAGRRQLLSAATALSSGAGAVLLDEPFTGLDVGLRRVLRDRIIGVAGDHPELCLVLTSHRSEDLAGLVDDVTTISDAGIVAGPISLDAARASFPTMRGPSAMVDAIAGDAPRAAAKSLGGIAEVTLSRPLSCSASRRAAAEGITITHPEDGELIDLLALHSASADPGTTTRAPATTRNEP